MKEFFDWLSNPGIGEELFVLILLLIILGVFIFILKKSDSVDTKWFKIKNKKKEEATTNNSEQTKGKDNKNDNLCGSNASIIASQDYRIISLIVQSHAGRIREEMKQYCSINGLDKKTKDEYMMYVDEKKNLYIAELKEMFNHEYMSYDIIDITDIYEIIDESKEALMNKLEKLYIKVRDISIEEHSRLNAEKIEKISEVKNRFMTWYRASYATTEERESALAGFIDEYRDVCEKLVVNERIDILNKQVQKIDMAKKDLIDIIMKKVIEKMTIKLNS